MGDSMVEGRPNMPSGWLTFNQFFARGNAFRSPQPDGQELKVSSRTVIVDEGFAGANLARRLERRLPGADVRLVCPTDYMPYLPLLPQVAAGVIPPRAAAVSLGRRLRRTTLIPGRAVGADLDARRVDAASQAPE